jgi:hypothetical protein
MYWSVAADSMGVRRLVGSARWHCETSPKATLCDTTYLSLSLRWQATGPQAQITSILDVIIKKR